jgi:hypothetical protein
MRVAHAWWLAVALLLAVLPAGRVVAADAVLVTDGAAVVGDDLAGGGLQRAPARERYVGVGMDPEEEGRVEARAVEVDVREVGEGVDALSLAGERAAQSFLDRGEERGDAAPGRGRLERVDRPARLPERVPQVRGPEAVAVPLPAERPARRDAAPHGERAEHLPARLPDEVLSSRDSDEQKALLLLDARQAVDLGERADQPGEVPGAPVRPLAVIGVDVLAEQGDLTHPARDQCARLGDQVGERPADLGAPRIGHDAIGAEFVAAFLYGQEGAGTNLAPGGQGVN